MMWLLIQAALLVAKFTVLPQLPWLVVLFPTLIVTFWIVLLLGAAVIAAILG